MQTRTQELESYEVMMHNLMIMKEEAIQTMFIESEALEDVISNVFTKIAHCLKENDIEKTEAVRKELESYERIIQDLLTLKEAAMETKMNEAKAIDASLQKIATFCDYNAAPLEGEPTNDDMEAIFGQSAHNIVLNIN